MEQDKKKYEPPKAMRLDDKESGKGLCDPSGSGDSYCMESGNSAVQCYEPGNEADARCDTNGSNGW